VTFRDVPFRDATFSDATFSDATFSDATFSDVTFSDVTFSDVTFSDVTFGVLFHILSTTDVRVLTSPSKCHNALVSVLIVNVNLLTDNIT